MTLSFVTKSILNHFEVIFIWHRQCNISFSSLLFYSIQISKQHLQVVKDRFQAFLNGDTQIVADEAFINAVQSYYEVRSLQTHNSTHLVKGYRNRLDTHHSQTKI